MGRFGHRFGRRFRNPLDIDVRAGGARAIRDRLRHRLDMAVAGIVKNENLGHG